ncbi:hypothetical protein MD484_g8394, partial [Candolleomyces efflorescens]
MLDTNAPIAISQPVGPETPFRAFDSDVNFRNWLDATRVGMTTLLKEAEQAVKDRDNVINQRGSRIKEVEMRLEAVTEERNALIRDGFTLRAEARDAVAYRDELIKERDGKLLRYERLLALATEEKHKGIKDRRVIQKNAEEIVARRDREIREQRSTIEALEARLAAVTDRKNVMASEQSSVSIQPMHGSSSVLNELAGPGHVGLSSVP